MSDLVAAALIVAGGVLSVIGGLGLVRMPDVLIRMHAATKIGTLATGLILAAAAVSFADGAVTVQVILIILFLLLTAPIASHMIGRAAVAMDVPLFRGTKERSLAVERPAETDSGTDAGTEPEPRPGGGA